MFLTPLKYLRSLIGQLADRIVNRVMPPITLSTLTTGAPAPTHADAQAITIIELPAVSGDELAREMRLLCTPLTRETSSDYARSFPVAHPSLVICRDCMATGVIVTSRYGSPDDFDEQRCNTCLGAGVLDIGDADTLELAAMP